MKYKLVLISVLFFLPCLCRAESLDIIIEKIEEKVAERTAACPIIGIGGCPGVGKSTIAKVLQVQLRDHGISSAIVSLDHYGLSPEDRKQFSSELDPRRIRWDQLHHTLSEIRQGKTEVVKPTINQLTKERGEETLDLSRVDCILFEGSYALGNFSPMDYLQYADLTIYLETALDNIYTWKWERDQKKPAPRTEEIFFHHMMEILQDFVFHVYPTRENADYTIQIGKTHDYVVLQKQERVGVPDFTSLRLEMLNY